MHLMFHIVYAAHASGTHDRLALDALRHLQCTDAGPWQRLFLLHASLYLEGAKAPDADFKDYQNHVLHTRDGYWGGAPGKVVSWYHHVVEALGVGDWPTAVYCAGVLSHYFMDPLQPFHTAQSEAENNIHRAAEWSIWRSYDALYRLSLREFADLRVEPANDPNWLVELVCRGADLANGDYEKLIAHYHIGRGVVDPAAGLDPVGRRIVARMIRFACLGYAAVLACAIGESGVLAPEIGLAAPTLLAAVQIPAKALARCRADAEERRAVERMYDELMTTGTVETHLPEDDRMVRQLFAEEVLAQRAPRPQASQVFPLRPRRRIVTRIDELRAARRGAAASAEIIALRPAARPAPTSVSAPAARSEAYPSSITREPMLFLVPSEPRPDRVKAASIAKRHAPEPAAVTASVAEGESGADEEPHVRLTLDHDVADCPSVGPKLAKRFVRHGIKTVRDLIKADPAALAVRLNARSLTAHAICDWQDEALLACAIPGLRGVHAQLLVRAGYRSASAIAEAEPDKLCADVLAFAVTPAGRRMLRKGGAPDIGRIKGWLAAARRMQAA
jgi:hypothetical protein